MTSADRRAAFAKLHESGCFVIPNPWDVGTARFLRHLGFRALATTSAGFQFSRGQPDTVWGSPWGLPWGSPRDVMLAHIAEIVAATDLPVNADFQSGYAHEPEGVAANVALCVDTGVAGLSIEDGTGNPEQPLYDLSLAVQRIKAARAALDATGAQVLLTARAESYLVGHPQPLTDVLRRLTAYAEAGADVLFAPGARTPAELGAIVRAVAPKPVNALVAGNVGFTVADLAALGVRRISVGSALARAAWGAFIRAATAIADHGSFDGLDGATPFAELNAVFGLTEAPPRGPGDTSTSPSDGWAPRPPDLPRGRASISNKVVNAPSPPYYAVIAPAELHEDIGGYPETAAKLVELAKEQPGFLGIESGSQKGFALAVSYWASLEAIQAWRENARHMIAKEKGKSTWFKKYLTRIAKVERVY